MIQPPHRFPAPKGDFFQACYIDGLKPLLKADENEKENSPFLF